MAAIKNAYVRATVAIVIGWTLVVIYTIYIYNPAGIAAGLGRGAHFPKANYDNNTIAATIAGGWMYPAISIVAYLFLRLVYLRVTTKPFDGRG